MPLLSSNVSVAGLVVFGTFSSLAAKIAYELQGTGRGGVTHSFEKPWAMTTVMFLGMSLCLPLAVFLESRDKAKYEAALTGGPGQPLLEHLRPPPAPLTWRQTFMLGIPTAFDLVATVLMNVGLLTVTASVYQMMRGAEMLFAALFAVTFLHRSLNRWHGLGIAACIAGIAAVGYASTAAGESGSKVVSKADIVFGMGLIVASQAVQAAQLTFEDHFMADLAIEPLRIVGYEGVFGALACVLVALPLAQLAPGFDGSGVHEDSIDTLTMIASSPSILTFLLADMFALAALNISGMCVTGHFGAVFRTVLETTRTLFVWIVDLVLHVLPIAGGALGESWNKKWSPLQALGFAVLVSGTVVYGWGDDAEAVEEAVHLGAEAAAQGLPAAASPTPLAARAYRIPGRAGSDDEDASSAPAPIPIAGSFRSTMNFTAFSASLPRGSLPNSLPHLPPIRTSIA